LPNDTTRNRQSTASSFSRRRNQFVVAER
jgi:hypothetical protein